ncbi:MAG: hypothetical protein HY855_19820 [Burkholderiales bacterium]|nr:hypothetical protein [Burkholderiales bacterium]
MGVDAGVQRSLWEERSALGHRLVRERGTLAAASLALATHCLPGHWRLQFGHAQGEREYDGQTTTATPLRSSSRLRTGQLRLQGLTDDTAGLALGIRFEAEHVARDIASVGPVAGYPERFTLLTAAAGLRHLSAPWAHTRLALEAWAGGGPPGRMRMQPPGFDTARLRLGASRHAQLAAQIGSAPAADAAPATWRWQLRLQCSRQFIAAGPGEALTRNGVLVGGAAQPETHRTDCGATAGVQWQFG